MLMNEPWRSVQYMHVVLIPKSEIVEWSLETNWQTCPHGD